MLLHRLHQLGELMERGRCVKNSDGLEAIGLSDLSQQFARRSTLPFFIKKNDDEGLSFYYLGDLTAIHDEFVITSMAGQYGAHASVVKMEFLLDREIDLRLHKYLTDT